MTETLKVIKERRSTRAFKPSQLPRETIEKVLEAGTWSPSGMGKQQWHFVGILSAEKCLDLAKVVGAADNRDKDYNFYGAPAHIIVSCPTGDNHAFVDGSAAIQTMLLMAHAMGVGSCWINQIRATCDTPEVRSMITELGVPENHTVVGSIALGYIAKETPAKARKENLFNIVE